MALSRKVDLGGRRKWFDAVELPRFNTVIRKGLAKKAEEEFAKFEEWTATGVAKRIDHTKGKRREQAEHILEWMWSHGLSMVQQIIAPNISTIQLAGNPVMFHKWNLNREKSCGDGLDWGIRGGPSVLEEDIKPLVGKVPKEITCPDGFFQWSGDMQYPWNFAMFSQGELALRAMLISNERGWCYPLAVNNAAWNIRKNNSRLGSYIGAPGTNIPGEYVMDKHRFYHEKPLRCRHIFTPLEEEFMKNRGWDQVQYSAFEKLGIDADQMYEDLTTGKLDDELMKPGVKVDHTCAIPWQRRLRRGVSWWRGKNGFMGGMDWWKETNRCTEDGVMIGFGEFEEEEFRAQMKTMGYNTVVDEDSLFKSKIIENISAECKIPDEMKVFEEISRERTMLVPVPPR